MPRCPTCHRRIPEAAPCPADGSFAPPWIVPEDVANAKPPVVPGFTVQMQLGMGGFSIVWQGIREPDSSVLSAAAGEAPVSTRRLLAAIKVARGDSPIVVERFRRDAEALARIGPPSTPRLYKSGRLDDGRPYIAMELLSGKSLDVREEALPGPPDAGWVVRVAVAVLDAIGAAHARGFLHRDLKPENIFLDDTGRRATLIDFGLTRSTSTSEEPSITRSGTVVGTPEYMAPEQIRGDAGVDVRADVYAFGVILYELCTLRVPFAGDRASIEHGHVALRPPRPREFAAISEPLEELILACLAKEPGRRPADVGVVRRALLEACPPGPVSSSGRPGGATTTIPPPGSRPSSSKARLLSEGRRPMVVLVVETNAAALPVSSAVTRCGGFVARQRASSYVCVFSGIDVEDPAQAAISAAREMVARFGARAALHLAALAMRRQESAPPAVYGAAVERPETWLPTMDGWSGVMLTAEIARVVPESDLGLAAENAAFIPLAAFTPASDGSQPWEPDSHSTSGVMPRSSGPNTESTAGRSSRGRSLSSPGFAASPPPPSVKPISGSPPPPPPSPPPSQPALSRPRNHPLTIPSPSAGPPSQRGRSQMPPLPQLTQLPPLTQRSPRASSSAPPSIDIEAPPASEPRSRPPSSQPLTQPSMSGRSRRRPPHETPIPPHHSEMRPRTPSDNESAVRPTNERFRKAPPSDGGPAPWDASSSFPPWSGVKAGPPSDRPTDPPDELQTMRPSEPMTQPSSHPPSSFRSAMGPVSLTHRLPLFGRDDVIASMQDSAAASFNGSCPGLFTLLGDSGLGKTRLAGEALGVVDRLRPGAAVIFQRAAQPLADAAGQTTRELLGRVLGVHGSEPLSAGGNPASAFPPPDDPRAFCRGRLGEDLGEEVWRAVTVTLGWSSGDALSVSPGAIQRGAMLALTEGLRRLSRDGPVVLVLDDAHWADDTALDALEYATLNAEGCPLWVLIAAHPRFENVRRGWGSRAQRHDRVVLDPLEEAAGMQLAAELLLPAEYPPAATLKRLADWAGGNPACLAELARTLKRAGIVRQRPNLGTWYVATAELDRLPPSTAWQWLAVRQLDALQPELAACVRLCSVMGVEFARTEVEWVQDAMEREGVAVTPIDMGVGLGALVERRILLRGSGDRYSFQSSTFQDAVYKLLDASHREKIHRYALQFFRSQRDEVEDAARVLDRLARHAGACGASEEAAEAYLALGDAARDRHRHVEADQHYTSALMFLSEGDTRRRALALAGRGKVRYRVHRIREALEDLRQARELARALADDALMADLLLEEATVHDFANGFAESARCVEEARPLIEKLGDPRLEFRFCCALGLSYYHQQRLSEAVELCRRSADGAQSIGDYETRVIALVILAPLLVSEGQLDEADRRFHEVLALCTEAEDRLHLGAAYANRAYLWAVQKRRDRGMEDLRRAIQLAREVGNPWSECIATCNVAEFLHWLGEEDEALVMTRRVRVLEERFMERPASDGALLLARIQAARGEFDESAQCLNWIAEHCRPTDAEPTHQAFFQAMSLVLEHVGVTLGYRQDELISWNDIVEKASGGMFTEELLEVLYWRLRVAIGHERWDEASETLARVEERVRECPMWPFSFVNLKSRLMLRQPQSMPVNSHPADDFN